MSAGSGRVEGAGVGDADVAAGGAAPAPPRGDHAVAAVSADADGVERARFVAQRRHRAAVRDADPSADPRERAGSAAKRGLVAGRSAQALDEDARRGEPAGLDGRAGDQGDGTAGPAAARIDRAGEACRAAVPAAAAIAAEMDSGAEVAERGEAPRQADRDCAAVSARAAAAADQRAGSALAAVAAPRHDVEGGHAARRRDRRVDRLADRGSGLARSARDAAAGEGARGRPVRAVGPGAATAYARSRDALRRGRRRPGRDQHRCCAAQQRRNAA
ncbi:MAG: hypothetical protein WDN24_01640 [Sphingomonas sp.]